MSSGPRLVLVGPPGAGKSTVARTLAARWGVAARDTDADVEDAAGRPIADIFIEQGEAAFRALEREAVARALSEHRGVLALGGGAVLDPTTQDALARYRDEGGVVVFLDVSLAQAAPRVGLTGSRPLLLGNPRAQWKALMDARRPVYEGVSTLIVSTDERTARQVADEVATAVDDGSVAPGATSGATAEPAARTTTERQEPS